MLNYLHHTDKEAPKNKPKKKEEPAIMEHPRINFAACPFNRIIYSKASG